MSLDYTADAESYGDSTYRPYGFMDFDDFPQFGENLENIRNDMMDYAIPELDGMLGTCRKCSLDPIHVVWELPKMMTLQTRQIGSVSAFSVILSMSDSIISVHLGSGGRAMAHTVDLLVVDAYGLCSGCDRGYVTFTDLRCRTADDARLFNGICSAVLGYDVDRYRTTWHRAVSESVDYTADSDGYGLDRQGFDALADAICSLTEPETMEIRQVRAGDDAILIADMAFDMRDMAFVNSRGRAFGFTRVLLTFERENVRGLYLTVRFDGYGGECEFEYWPESDEWKYMTDMAGFSPKHTADDPEFVATLRAMAKTVNPDSDSRHCVGMYG